MVGCGSVYDKSPFQLKGIIEVTKKVAHGKKKSQKCKKKSNCPLHLKTAI